MSEISDDVQKAAKAIRQRGDELARMKRVISDREVMEIIQQAVSPVEADLAEVRAELERVRQKEREACARMADTYPQRDPAEDGSGYWAAEEIAAAIRNRSTEGEG